MTEHRVSEAGLPADGGWRPGGFVVAIMVLVGAVGGLAWLGLAPRVKIRLDAQGGEYVDPSLRQYVDADIWFGGICLVIGVVAGLVVWRRLHARPTMSVVSLAIGGCVGSAALWWVGQYFGRLDVAAARTAKNGTVVLDSLDLGAKGLLGAMPMAAIATWLAVDVITDWRRRRSPLVYVEAQAEAGVPQV